jgi:hypothetical protein
VAEVLCLCNNPNFFSLRGPKALRIPQIYARLWV